MPDASLSLTAKSSFKGNPEFGQAIVRMLIWVTVTALVFIGAYTDYYPGNYLGYSLFSGTFLVVSLFVLYSIVKTPRSRWRIYATIPFDVTSISAVMLLTESGPFSPWFLFYPWIYIGYGVRYGRVELSPFNLEWVVKAVVNIFLPQTDKKGIRLEYQLQAGLPEMVVGDHNRLRQILLNLISNAVKYTDEGYVRLTVHKPDDNGDIDTLHFEIEDTGIGIEKNQLQHIFEPFYQCQIDPAEQRHGTRLGTTISSRLVNAMYSTIGANSVYGKGSTFWFNLPLPVVDSPAHTQISPGTPEGDSARRLKIHILLAEDTPIVARVISTFLTQEGCRVTLANNGKEALDALKENADIDLVLMDMRMPEMTGLEVTRHWRQIEKQDKHIPIIALTAHSTTIERDQCFAAGMDHFITKPVSRARLFEVIHEFY